MYRPLNVYLPMLTLTINQCSMKQFRVNLIPNPNAIPALDGSMKPLALRGFFFTKMENRYKDRNNGSYYDDIPKVEIHEKRINKLLQLFGHLLSDYDVLQLMNSTCALGLIPPRHSYLEESGTIQFGNDMKYSDSVIRRTAEDIKPTYSNKVKYYSIPRGTNPGWPFFVPGTRRELTNKFLLISAAIALGARKVKSSLSSLLGTLSTDFGHPIHLSGERFSHTDKEMIANYAEGIYTSTSFHFRVRMILMVSKISVIFNKPEANNLLDAILKSSFNFQDRSIMHPVQTYLTNSMEWVQLPTDIKKYDHHIRGERLQSILKIINAIDPSINTDNFITEMNGTIVTAYQGSLYTQSDTSYPQMLVSGASPTTVIGTLGSRMFWNNFKAEVSKRFHVNLREADNRTINPGNIADSLKHFDTVHYCHGDDNWGAIRVEVFKKLFKHTDDFLQFYGEINKIEVKLEDLSKFLGFVSGNNNFQGTITTGTPVYRFIQSLIYPERRKQYPFTVVGYIAKVLMQDSQLHSELHNLVLQIWDNPLFTLDLGPKFEWKDRQKVLDDLKILLLKHPEKLSQLNEEVLRLTSGLTEHYNLLDLPPELSNLLDIMGMPHIKSSDPEEFFNLLSEDVDKPFITRAERILQGQLQDAPVLAKETAREANLIIADNGYIF